MKKLFLMAIAMLSITNLAWTMTSPQTKAQLVKAQLVNALRTDNVTSLQQFIQKNPNFNWTQLSTGLPWSVETGTPLIAAVSFKAVNCVNYLLSKNIGNIASSINTKSSHGITALQYASDITGKYYSPAIAQIIKNSQTPSTVPSPAPSPSMPYADGWGM